MKDEGLQIPKLLQATRVEDDSQRAHAGLIRAEGIQVPQVAAAGQEEAVEGCRLGGEPERGDTEADLIHRVKVGVLRLGQVAREGV